MLVSDASDSQLIQAILSGETSLYETLMDRYHETVFQIACDLTGNEEDAALVVEDVFVNLYRDLGSIQGETFLETVHRYTYDTALSKLVFRIEGHLEEVDTVTQEMLEGAERGELSVETDIIVYDEMMEEFDDEIEEARSKLDCAMQLINCATMHIASSDEETEH